MIVPTGHVAVPCDGENCRENTRFPFTVEGRYGSVDHLCPDCAAHFATMRKAQRVLTFWEQNTGLPLDAIGRVA